MPEAQPLPPPRRYQRLLNKAVKNPRSILNDGRTRKPRFCLPFFDLCDAMAYERPEQALEHAAAAVELGRRSGDLHLANRSLGVEVNALIARAQWEDAEEALRRQETPAAGCCESCLADYLHRRADLALEHRRTDDALLWLSEAGPGLADGPGGAALGRALTLQAMGRHFRGENGAAIEDVGSALLVLPVGGPQMFCREALGLMASFVKGGDRRLDARALELVEAFKARLAGITGWQIVRTRLFWVEGVLHARLGDEKRADACLESARTGLRKELGIPLVGGSRLLQARRAESPETPPEAPTFTDRESREMIALIADVSQLACQRRESPAIPAMLDTARRFLALDRDLRRTLDETYEAVETSRHGALEILVDLRAAVRVPVPDVLAEKYLTRSRRRFARPRPPSATPYCYSAVPG